MPPKIVSSFRAPTAYEEEMLRAKRQQQLAEMLRQQAFMQDEEPFTFQGFRAMPSPAGALSRVLQAYAAKKVGEKAEQAETRAREADVAEFEALRRDLGPQTQVTGPDMFADPMGMASKYTPPVTQTVMPTFQEQETRLVEALSSGSPRAQRYAQLMLSRQPNVSIEALMEASPETREEYQRTRDPFVLTKPSKPLDQKAPVFTGGKFYNYETKKWEDIPGYVEQQSRIAAASRAPESLVMVDVNGKPVLTPRSQAVGKTAFVNKPVGMTGDDKVDRRKHRETRIQLQNAYDSIGEFAKELQNTPKEASLYGEAAGRLSSKYKLALGAVRVLQNTGVLNPGELPFIEDTLRNPQSLAQLFNPASRETIFGQVNSIADLLEKQSATNDELFEYDITPLKGRDWRASSIPAKAKAAGLTQADWDAATEEERAAWR